MIDILLILSELYITDNIIVLQKKKLNAIIGQEIMHTIALVMVMRWPPINADIGS
jgi:hypothetical protein